MFCASIISATSLYVLAAVKTALPPTVHVTGLEPPSSTTVMPTLAPLSANRCCKATTRALDARAAAAAAVLGRAPIAVSLFDAPVSAPLTDPATDVVTCRGARADAI